MRGFRHHSPIGRIQLLFAEGEWHLYIGGQYVNAYYAAMKAVEDVCRHTTGFDVWDSTQADSQVSDDLDDWDSLEPVV